MRISPSPIKLGSSSKAKLKATKSPLKLNDQNLQTVEQLKSSINVLPRKESLQYTYTRLRSNFSENQVQLFKNRPYNTFYIQSGSPRKVHNQNELKVFINSNSPQKLDGTQTQYTSNRMNKTTVVNTQRHLISQVEVKDNSPKQLARTVILPLSESVHLQTFRRVEVNRQQQPVQQSFPAQSHNIQAPTLTTKRPVIMISPPKVLLAPPIQPQPQLTQITITPPQHLQPSPKQIQLQRKVKILQSRISQLHNQKTQLESNFNQIHIRLQYQNNFLKQKLNTLQNNSLMNINLNNISNSHNYENIQNSIHLNQQISNNCCKKCPQQQIISNLNSLNSQHLIKQLQKESQNQQYQYQCHIKQINQLKINLNQAEGILSEQISKSLKLLEELENVEMTNEELKKQLKQLGKKFEMLEKEVKNKEKYQEELKIMKVKLNESQIKNKELQKLLEESNKNGQLDANMITKQLLDELQQNNQLLIQAVKQMEQKYKQSQSKVKQLEQQKQALQENVEKLQNSLSTASVVYKQKQRNLQVQLQQLTSKLCLIEQVLKAKQTQITEISCNLNKKILLIKNQEQKIESLLKQQGPVSTSSSFYKQTKACDKCDELKKTVFKLSGYLRKSSSQLVVAQ